MFKKRIARPDGGKSGGYRTVLGFKKSGAGNVFFLFGFPKNKKSNISFKEQLALATLAKILVNSTGLQIAALKVKGIIVEVECLS